jgi:elongation factor G
MVAESNEDLMEEFFEKGSLPSEDLLRGLRQAVRAGKIFPVLPASAMRNVGIHPLLDAIVDLVPSPSDRGEVEGTDPVQKTEVSRQPAPDAPLSLFVFKTVADPHAGRISLFRVYSGTLKADSTMQNANRDVSERVGALSLLQGKAQTNVPEILAGDLGAVTKLKETQTNDTLCDKAHPIAYPPSSSPSRRRLRHRAKTRGDEDKISSSLHKIMEEDPVLRLSRDAQTHEVLLSGMGQLHIEVVVGKLRKRFKVEVNLKRPKIPYLETLKAAAEGHGRTRSRPAGTASSATARSA